MDGDTESLLRDASRGDDAAMGALLERHLPALHAFVRLRAGELVRGRESCSDLVQSVCREVLRDADGFEYRGEAAFRRWLFDRALHKVIDRHRFWRMAKRDVGREARPAEPITQAEAQQLLGCYGRVCSPSQAAMAHEEVARIEAAFQQLDEPYREVISLCRLMGMTLAEAAAATQRSEGSVRGLLARGLARFARLLERDS